MKELVVLSGKGGTGKTSITAAFAALGNKIVVADCDVDAADLHLVLSPLDIKEEDFYSGWEPIVLEYCKGCGTCRKLCRYDAVTLHDGKAEVDTFACEGCGVCADHCPSFSITMQSRHSGMLFESNTPYGWLVHAVLDPGGENSGKLVVEVRKRSRKVAEESGAPFILTDGPPGIGCPVIASLGGASAVLIVVEPTLSSLHDMGRVIKLCRHFSVPAMLCVNKADLNKDIALEIESLAVKEDVPFLGSIPMDNTMTAAQLQAKPVVELNNSKAANNIRQIWHKLKQHLELDE
jgi:MinD superfamily P-loop ATPase